MTALDELHEQCERRGWRLALTGTAHEPDATPSPRLNIPGMLIDGLEVRGCKVGNPFGRALMARVPVDGLTVMDLDAAAVRLARSLQLQGLIT